MSPAFSPRFHGVRAKIERARQHVYELGIQLRAYHGINRQPIVIEPDPETGEKVFRVRFETPVPDIIALVTGDAAHNLRSALDHLAWQLVEANGQTPDWKTSYPICDTADGFAKAQSKVRGIDPAALPIIEATQPYQTGYEDLKVLSELDNFDKHRLLIAAAAKTGDFFAGLKGHGFTALHELAKQVGPVCFEVSVNAAMLSNPGKPVFPKNGDIIVRVPADNPLKELAQVEMTFPVAFVEPENVCGRHVLPCLTQLTDLVDRVVDQFALFV